jgi:hypothetical protein
MSLRCKKCVYFGSQNLVIHSSRSSSLPHERWLHSLWLVQPSCRSANRTSSRRLRERDWRVGVCEKDEAMRIVLGLFVIMTATFLSTSRAIPGTSVQSPEGVHVIEVTAKKYEFTPSPIRVKQGTRVQLKITATDHAHGFKIKPYLEGAHPTDSPGLIFSSTQSYVRIEKHQTVTIEFLAKAAGTYFFKCCTFCGWHG